jgi:DNA (cytosine-5)-methyltransferase 1
MAKTYGDLFTGLGGASTGALAAGYTPLWGVELRADVAEVANANLGGHVRVANILDEDPMGYERVDHLHASPPCPNFSVAKAGGKEQPLDIALARKVAEFVRVLTPETCTLENVYAYRRSRSWAVVEDALHRMGYWVSVEHVNSADYAVPQTRKRMIVRAIRGGFVPYLPQPVAWVGWYAAIEDLLDTLPESRFAEWQLVRLPEGMNQVLINCQNTKQEWGKLYRDDDEPSFSIVSHSNSQSLRAFIIDGQTNEGERLTARTCDEPMLTVGAGTGSKRPARAWLSAGRVVAMTPRALARFQSFPDTYELPEKRTLAAYGIGNAVCPLMFQKILEGMAHGA